MVMAREKVSDAGDRMLGQYGPSHIHPLDSSGIRLC